MKKVTTFENFLNERSINKISKDLEAVATEMVKTVGQWKAAKGDKKAELLEILRALNKEKAELEKELDSAVAGKDKNIQLILTEEVEATAHFENEVRDILDEAKYNKKKLLKAIKNKDDMFIQLGDGTELIVYNPDSNNKDNAEMWHDDVVFAIDQDGEEHEVKYSDIAGIGESTFNEGMMSELDLMAKEAKSFSEFLKDVFSIPEYIKHKGKRDVEKFLKDFYFSANESVTEGKRDNNKVTTAWKKTGVTDLPSIAKMYADAMQDANFHREIPTSKAIGAASKAKVKKLGDMYTSISQAAGWSGYAIANGTVQYLKHIGEEGAASKLLKAITKYDLNESVKVFEEFTKENKNLLLEANPLHPNLSKKNLAKLKKLGHTGMKSAILWTDGHSSNPTYIQIPGEDGIPWGSKGPKDRTTFYWDGENAWCTNYPKETLRADYKKSVDTAEEFSDATKSISDSGKWEKVEKMQEQFINERRIQIKRKYTENHPARTAGKTARVRNKILEYISDGKLTQDEFNKILSELSLDSKRWLKRNQKYFSISEEGISLSTFGKRILKGITINENQNKKGMKIFTAFKDYLLESESVDEKFKISKPGTKKAAELLIKALAKVDKKDYELSKGSLEEGGFDLDQDEDEFAGGSYFIGDNGEIVNAADSMKIYGNVKDSVNDIIKNLKSGKMEIYGRFAGESVEEADYDMLLEAIKSTKLARILKMSNDKKLLKRIYNMSKIPIDKIGDENITEVDPEKAYKEKYPHSDVVIFYISTREKENPYAKDGHTRNIPSNSIIGVTDGDRKIFEPTFNHHGGDTDYSKGVKPASDRARYRKTNKEGMSAKDRYPKSGTSSPGSSLNLQGSWSFNLGNAKRIASVSDVAYVVWLSAIPSAEPLRGERARAKEGAIAFEHPKDFKKANMDRYKMILAKRADKPEKIDKDVEKTIEKAHKLFTDAFKTKEMNQYGYLIVGKDPRGRDVTARDITSFITSLMDDWQRYSENHANAKKEEERDKGSRYGSASYYQKEAKSYALAIKQRLNKFAKMDIAW